MTSVDTVISLPLPLESVKFIHKWMESSFRRADFSSDFWNISFFNHLEECECGPSQSRREPEPLVGTVASFLFQVSRVSVSQKSAKKGIGGVRSRNCRRETREASRSVAAASLLLCLCMCDDYESISPIPLYPSPPSRSLHFSFVRSFVRSLHSCSPFRPLSLVSLFLPCEHHPCAYRVSFAHFDACFEAFFLQMRDSRLRLSARAEGRR